MMPVALEACRSAVVISVTPRAVAWWWRHAKRRLRPPALLLHLARPLPEPNSNLLTPKLLEGGGGPCTLVGRISKHGVADMFRARVEDALGAVAERARALDDDSNEVALLFRGERLVLLHLLSFAVVRSSQRVVRRLAHTVRLSWVGDRDFHQCSATWLGKVKYEDVRGLARGTLSMEVWHDHKTSCTTAVHNRLRQTVMALRAAATCGTRERVRAGHHTRVCSAEL